MSNEPNLSRPPPLSSRESCLPPMRSAIPDFVDPTTLPPRVVQAGSCRLDTPTDRSARSMPGALTLDYWAG